MWSEVSEVNFLAFYEFKGAETFIMKRKFLDFFLKSYQKLEI